MSVYDPDSANPTARSALVEKQSKGLSPEDFTWHTPEGIPLKALYTAEDIEQLPYKYDAWALPISGDRSPPCMRATLDHQTICRLSTAEASNAFIESHWLWVGQGISVAFDLATHRGYDSDHPRLRGCRQGWSRG